MKKTVAIILMLILLMSFCSCSSEKSDTEKSYVGELVKAGNIDVLVLEGTYAQMGEQYGSLLAHKLTENYNGIVEGLKTLEGLTLTDLQEMGEAIYSGYPKKYKQLVEGLAESSGLGMEKALVLLAQEIYVSTALSDWASKHISSGCTGMATWGDYSSDGFLVFGRNYDLGFFNHQYATLVVYNPIDGSLPVASFTFAGCIYVTTGMNSAGIFLELNNGSHSDPADFTTTRPWAPINLFSFLEQADTLSQLTAFFESTLPDLAYIVQGADKNGAVSYEWATSGVKVRQPDEDGLLIATNGFFDPRWNQPLPEPEDDIDFIVLRKTNLTALAEQNKGNFTPEIMMDVISTPLEEGGAFRYPNLTSYEIVAQPSTLTLWLRVPEYQDWVEVDLKQYFRR